MRATCVVVASLAIASSAAAQAKDPTTAVAAAPVPAGWSVRMDDKDASKPAKFVTMGPGYHVTSGGAGIYYAPANAQKDNFTVSANFRQTTKNVGHGDHGEAFGLFAGGRNLDDPAKQTYFYFLVRQDGMYLINHRAGPDVHKIVDWTASPAIHKFDDMPNAKNDLAIKVAADSVRFLVNGIEVHAISRKEITDASGQAGFRVNHNLDVHIASFSVK
ncbi:MAG: hypothetical protein JWM41_4871 [Gemmatimonadetes bacterium]|nr:hypothetical protein [Gemmatimonadota bacterium]